ncbi:S41 family peptidase [Chryseobacterium daecheongense]|nr:S41 family peptidase [Chryseobacterium daecheongense]
MRALSIVVLLFISINIFSAQTISEVQKLESLCKIWGFLKYYHPHVADGTFNWDQQLLQKIDELDGIQDKSQLNILYTQWLDSLGAVEKCNSCKLTNTKVYFRKNFNVDWINDNNIFIESITNRLQFIEENRYVGTPYYFGKGGRKIFFRNDDSTGSKFISKKIALLELFRYWNFVEYFFPYKYETNQNWDDILTEMIPKFLAIDNDVNYHLTLAELVTKTDDSHAFLFSPLISINQYGRRRIPVEYSYAEGKLIVTKINSNQYNEESVLKPGDIIYDINGKTISQMVNSFSKYIPASNTWGKIKKVKNLFLFSNSDSVEVKVEREGQNIALKAKTYLLKDIVYEKKVTPRKWQFYDEEKKIGIVNMGIIEREDLDEMYQNLKTTESIIFDLRNYPKQTIRPLSLLILPKTSLYYEFTFPETTYPGLFYIRKNSIGRNNDQYYKGNVVVLVDENTQSQAETTTMMFKQHPKAKIIGSHTSGANGDVIRFKIAGLETSFSGLGAYYPDQRETQRIGIIPDIIVRPTLKGIKAGKDEVLERALEYLKTGR